jgi:hypothetical protein
MTASLTAGAFLAGIGTMTIKAARYKSELPYAAIPLLFAIQQLSEGVVWWTFERDAPDLRAVMTQFYSFFSHVLWPVYIPVAVWLLEPPGRRRWLMTVIVVIGAVVGGYLLYSMVVDPIEARATGDHIEYVAPHFFAAITMGGYLLATTCSMLLSSTGMVRLFGVVALLAFVLAYWIYATWFISVWCFFAAILSLVVALRFFGRDYALREEVKSGS